MPEIQAERIMHLHIIDSKCANNVVTEFMTVDCSVTGKDSEVICHDGTVRDLIFVDNTRLVSGGAGDCKVYVTDCETKKTTQALSGHKGECFSTL